MEGNESIGLSIMALEVTQHICLQVVVAVPQFFTASAMRNIQLFQANGLSILGLSPLLYDESSELFLG